MAESVENLLKVHSYLIVKEALNKSSFRKNNLKSEILYLIE